MSLRFSHTIYTEYFEVVIEGSRTPGKEWEESASLWKQVFAISKNEDIKNILTLARIKGRFPLNAHINFALQLKDIGCTLLHRIAYVPTDRQIQKNPPLIFKYMHSAGYDIKIFKSREKAKRWLLQEKRKVSLLDLFDSFK